MYVIVMILIQMGQYKVVPHQVLYSSMEMCNTARSVLVQKLENSKPTEDSFIFSKCTRLSFEEHKSKVML